MTIDVLLKIRNVNIRIEIIILRFHRVMKNISIHFYGISKASCCGLPLHKLLSHTKFVVSPQGLLEQSAS